MKSKLYTFLFFVIFFNIQKLRSQDQDNTKKPYLPNITVAPPQAASLSKVGEIPVDISTGRMNYTIPIFEIKEGDFSMPINLSYNYSGLVLDESPGYAGVGWTFNIGGSILHSINGLNDEEHENDKTYIYNYINKLAPYNDQATPAGQTIISHFLESVSNGIFDGEPDKYSVNIGNISCSFYLDKDNNPIFLKNENYKLSGNSKNGFTLTDDQGINYVFNLIQEANKVTDNEQYDYTSSFLITEINFPLTSNKISFKYTSSGQYNDVNFSQSLIKTTNELGNPNNNFVLRNNTTTTIAGTLKLSKIITNGYVIDLEYSSSPAEKAIAVITNLSVKDTLSKSVKSYDFTYSEWVGRRTNLLNVKYNGAITNEMEYDMTLPYPVVQSNNDRAKKDLWGYYNMKGELIYANGITGSYNNPKLRPDFESTKIGALTKITYQTKGYSLIEYEPNSVYMNSDNYNFPYDSDGLSIAEPVGVSTNPDNPEGSTQELTFNITDVPVELTPKYQFTNGFEMAGEEYRTGQINLYENDNVKLTAKQYWGLEGGGWTPAQRTFINSDPRNIIHVKVPGIYRLEAISSQGITAELNVTFKKTSEFFNQVVGGIRVKQIKNCDFNGECTTTVYNYFQNGKSTGLMLQRPEFYSGSSIQDNVGCSQGTYVKQQYYNFTSIYPLSNYRGSPVLYKKVEKTDFGLDENNQLVSNGKTVFTYNGNEVLNSLQDEELYFTIGQLDTKLIKDDSGTKLSKQKNNYLNQEKPDVSRYIYALQCKVVFERRGNASGSGGSSGSGCGLSYPRPMNNFQINQFRHEAKNYILQNEVSTNYYQGDSLVQATFYDYNFNTGFLKSQITKNSKKEDLKAKYFYPSDSEMASEPFRNELIAKNRIKTPLVTQNYNGVKLSEQKTEYTQDATTSNLLIPKYVYANKGTAPIDKNIDRKVTYDKYDDKGNILQYTLEGGTPVSIIWGYRKTQPIAKVENKTYDQISSYVVNLQSLSDVDADNCMSPSCTEELLRIGLKVFRDAFPNAFISTYTYDPLVGVTSVTDPKGVSTYYEYDSFGRLRFVKDKFLNVLQKYCYNYKGQQVDCSDNSSTSVILYKSVAKSGWFTRKDCAMGGVASSVIYNQGVGAATSTISQAEADALGSNKFDTDGEAYANAKATCTFSSAAKSGLFTRNNCAAGGTPESITYTVPAGRYKDVSQAGADGQAQNDVNNNGLAYANANAKCTFWNVAKSGWFTRNNCAAGGVPGGNTYTVPAGSYDDVSQAGADEKAQNDVNRNGQAYANATAKCTFWNVAKSGWFVKNNCATGGVPDGLTYTVSAGSYYDVSQEGADIQAQNDVNNNGQAYVNAKAKCTFYSVARSGAFLKDNCTGGALGSSVTFSQVAGAAYSNISQEDANNLGAYKFYTDGNAYANANGTCAFYNTAVSRTANKSDCGAGRYGTAVTYTVPANKYSSTTSQASADQLAQNELNSNSTAYINANGACTSETYNVFVADAEESQKKFWVTVTSSSSNHPERVVNVNFYYSYAIGRKIYWGYWGDNLILPAGVTSKTFILSLSFIGYPELDSFTVN